MSRKNSKNYYNNDDYPAGSIGYMTRNLNELTNVLSDTRRNLNEIDQTLFKNTNSKAFDGNHENFSKRLSRYEKNEKLSSASDIDERFCPRSSSHEKYGNKHNVCFSTTNMNNHELNQKHDLSYENDKFYGSIKSDNRICSKDDDESVEKRLENRLQSVYNKMKREKEKNLINNDIKILLEEFKHPKEEQTKKVYNEEAHRTQLELLATKKRLAELEDSKSGLVCEVQSLKDQLTKLESATIHNTLKASKSEEKNEHYQKLEKELEYLKSELNRSKQTDKSDEIIKQIEKHDRQKDFLSDHNQALKLLLKEKESQYYIINDELRNVREKNCLLEKSNQKLQLDLESALTKLSKMTYDSEKYNSYLRACEEQVNLSEKKREELKLEAQETIKLWKNKVKKLEKNLERLQTDCDKYSEENDTLRANEKNLNIQYEAKNKESLTLKEINTDLDTKNQNLESELRNLKTHLDELKAQNSSLKEEVNQANQANKTFESKLTECQREKNNSDHKALQDEARSKELFQKINELQNEVDSIRSEKREIEAYVDRLENEIQKLKAIIDNLERSEQEAKLDLNCVSKQALHNKENYEETLTKYNSQLQQNQFYLQKIRLENEDKIRQLQNQLAEVQSNLELVKSHENDYIKEIDELKITRRRIEDQYIDLHTKQEKLARNEKEKIKIIHEYEEKVKKLNEEINQYKNVIFQNDSEYLKCLNLLDIETDVIVGLLASSINESYKPMLSINTETDKSKNLHLVIKQKLHWFGKNLEDLLQKQLKLQQNITFLEHELENIKKNCTSSLKTQDIFLKDLENKNNELLTERHVALKNMELLQQYLVNLSESIKSSSLREIERAHHLLAIENVNSLCNNKNLSEIEKKEILNRFNKYKNTINEIKAQLDCKSTHSFRKDCSKFSSNSSSSFGSFKECKEVKKKKAVFK